LKGAIVFLVVFVIGVFATIASPSLPPGQQIFTAIGAVETGYPILGMPVSTLVPAVFNGIIYGIVVWVIYSMTLGRGKDRQSSSQTSS
jgi:hypothetical protein